MTRDPWDKTSPASGNPSPSHEDEMRARVYSGTAPVKAGRHAALVSMWVDDDLGTSLVVLPSADDLADQAPETVERCTWIEVDEQPSRVDDVLLVDDFGASKDVLIDAAAQPERSRRPLVARMNGRRWVRTAVCFVVGLALGRVLPMPWLLIVAAPVGATIGIAMRPWTEHAALTRGERS
jgi:hypothetical protein